MMTWEASFLNFFGTHLIKSIGQENIHFLDNFFLQSFEWSLTV